MSEKIKVIPVGATIEQAKCVPTCPFIVAGEDEKGNCGAACTKDSKPVNPDRACKHGYSFLLDTRGYILGILDTDNIYYPR
jgi:hypothetical protein